MLRAELLMLRTDTTVTHFPPQSSLVKNIETEISRIEHELWAWRAVAPPPHPADQRTGVTNRAR